MLNTFYFIFKDDSTLSYDAHLYCQYNFSEKGSKLLKSTTIFAPPCAFFNSLSLLFEKFQNTFLPFEQISQAF